MLATTRPTARKARNPDDFADDVHRLPASLLYQEANSYEANIVRTGQESVFHMSIGLFMAGMFVSWT